MEYPRLGRVVNKPVESTDMHYYYNYGQPWTNYTDSVTGSYIKWVPDTKYGDKHTPLPWAVYAQYHIGSKTFTDSDPSYATKIIEGLINPSYWWALNTPYSRLAYAPAIYEDRNTYPAIMSIVDSPGLEVAIDNMYAKIASSDYDLGVEIGELTETVSYLTRAVAQAGNLLLDIKRGNFSKFFRRAFSTKYRTNGTDGGPRMNRRRFRRLDADGRWLESQFAVLPLLSSVDNAAKLAALGLEYDPILTYAGKYHQERYTHKEYLIGGVNGTMKYNGGLTVTHRVKTMFTISDPSLVALKNLGLINPGLIAWNLLPFSFVVDWILPVGKALSLMTALMGQSFKAGYQSIRVIGRIGYEVTSTNFWGNQTWVDKSSVTVNGFNREMLGQIPTWQPQVKSPFSWWHGVTAGALISKLVN